MKRNPSGSDSAANEPVPTSLGLKIARKILGLLHPTPAVIGGGLAMQLYGFQRNTKDVDLLALDLPPKLIVVRPVSFGGGIYNIKHGNKTVPVDVIVRSDSLAPLYRAAIENGTFLQGYPVPTAEHLALIKHRAGRTKDQIDLRFLIANKLFSINKAAGILRTVYQGVGGELLADEFKHDIAVEKAMMALETDK